MLHAVELPPSGGDTQFADMIRAYSSLSDEVRQQISGLRAVHSLEYMRISTDDRPPTDEEKRAAPPVVHPLVRTHPETGEKSLFIGMYCSHIVGMGAAASRALLDAFMSTGYFTFDHVARSESELVRLIEGGQVRVGIIIPPGYATSVTSGRLSTGAVVGP